MELETRIIKKEDMNTSNWSGGTTTQILIYPETADYSKRDFMWRLSSARVEVEESTFTSLPGIKRILMVLEGKLKINHEGHHNLLLEAYDTDAFLGDWITKSYGKVTDFNLMMKEGVSGELDKITIKAKKGYKLLLGSETIQSNYGNNIASFFYSPFNDIEIRIDDIKYMLCSGDLFFIDHTKANNLIEFENCKDTDITIVYGKVQY